MLCFVKINCYGGDDKADLLEKLAGMGWVVGNDQVEYRAGDDEIVIAANTNPTNSRGRVYIGEVITFVENEGNDFRAVEKDNMDLPGSNELVQCAGSGDWYYESDCKDSPEGLVCEEYFDDNFTDCERCENAVYTNQRVSDESGDHYCRDCYNEVYTSCDDCGCEVENDSTHYSERTGMSCCEGCHDSSRGGEFTGRRKSFADTSSFGSSRYFGLELETECGSASDSYAFDAKEDGSISGMEYVSHKLRGNAGLAETKAFMASEDGIEVEDSCGFHLHIDVSDLSNRDKYVVAAAFAVTEDYWFSKVNSSRQHNSYCNGLEEEFVENCFAAEANNTDFREFASYRDRYYWMNVSAYRKHSTFENRLHHGTWSYNTVESWVILNLRFVEAARKMRFLAGETVESFTARVKDCIEYAEAYAKSAKSLQPVTAA